MATVADQVSSAIIKSAMHTLQTTMQATIPTAVNEAFSMFVAAQKAVRSTTKRVRGTRGPGRPAATTTADTTKAAGTRRGRGRPPGKTAAKQKVPDYATEIQAYVATQPNGVTFAQLKEKWPEKSPQTLSTQVKNTATMYGLMRKRGEIYSVAQPRRQQQREAA